MSKTYFSKSDRLNDVVIIRSLAIIMVVAFHAYYMMMVEGHFPKSAQMYHDMYFNINCLILQFRMPLFIVISGYLFSHLENDKGKYKTLKDLFFNKFKRLMIPFYIFATIFMVSINDFKVEAYYKGGYQHLWFITMLFWCFIVTRLQSFLRFSNTIWFKIVFLVILFWISVFAPPMEPFLGIQFLRKWYFWFYFGYQIYLSRDKLYYFIDQHKYIYSVIFILLFGIGSWMKCIIFKDNSIYTWHTELANISIVILFWYWINYLLLNGFVGGAK